VGHLGFIVCFGFGPVQAQQFSGHLYKEASSLGFREFIWRRKEVQPPRAVSSRAGQEGGCGEEGKQDLKMANMRGAIDIPPPFRADPHVCFGFGPVQAQQFSGHLYKEASSLGFREFSCLV
jgi:hypothetical protein